MRKSLLIAILMLLPLLAGAQASSSSGFGLDGESDEKALRELRSYLKKIHRSRPTVALVLSGGGAKGAAHVGALRFMEQYGIPVDVVIGTSIGGLVGGLYCVGYSPEYLDSLFRTANWDLLLSDRIDREYITLQEAEYKRKYGLTFPFFYRSADLDELDSLQVDLGGNGTGRLNLSSRSSSTTFGRRNVLNSLPSGLYSGYNVCNLLSSLTVGYQQDDLHFLDMPTPFLCVATDVVSGKAKIWHDGPLTTAMRSTMSIPGMFKPVRVGNQILLDGGMRNNYPADIARDIGADIIIGIELSDAVMGYEDIYNLGDILYKGIDMLSNDAYERTLSIPTVTIKPDLHEFGMLSFDAESIETIIARGYEAAEAKADSLQMIRDRIGKAAGAFSGRKAVDISQESIRIDTILVSGVSRSDANYIRHRIAYLTDGPVDRRIIEDAVARIFSTRAFDYVNYDLLGEGDPYSLRLRCRRAPVSRVGLGARLDTEELVSVLFNVGLGVNKLSGQKLDLTALIGQNPMVSALYSYDAPALPTLNVLLDWKQILGDRVYIEDDPYLLSSWSLTQQFYVSNIEWSTIDFRLGLKNEINRIRTLVPEDEMDAQLPQDRKIRDNVDFFFRFRANTLDHAYFPKTGFSLGVDVDHVLTVTDGSMPNFTTVSGSWRHVFPLSEKWALLPSAHLRMTIGDDIPLTHANFLGGEFAGRYFDWQIPFAGLGNMALCGKYLGVARADLRYNMWKDHYFTAGINASYDFNEPDAYKHGRALFGVVLGYGYNSFLGPLKANLTWNSLTGSPGFYLSVGHEF